MKLKDFDFRLWHKPSESFVDMSVRGADLRIIPADDDYNMELELWTGYTDIKDARIYENDIIKVDEKTFSVSGYGGEVTAWILLESDGTPCCSLAEVMFESGRVEVIGNIHENADLLEEEKVFIKKCKYADIECLCGK